MMEHGVVQVDAPPSEILDTTHQQEAYTRMRVFMGKEAEVSV
jgi:hypothetical protein